MKKFIYKTIFFFGICAVTMLLFSLLEEDGEDSTEFMAAMVDKHKRIKSIEEPVLILNEVKDVAKKGDIVVLSLEYFMERDGEHDLHLLSSYYHNAALDYCEEHPKGLGLFLDYRHMMFKKMVTNYTTKNQEGYARTDFNKYGDGIKHLNMQNPSIQGSRYVIDANKDTEIKALNAFYDYAQIEGFKVVYAYSPYEQDEYQKNKKALLSLDRDLRKHMKIKLITSLEDFTYPNASFFDNVYHLNAKGRKNHTEKLIQLLRPEVEVPSELAIR